MASYIKPRLFNLFDAKCSNLGIVLIGGGMLHDNIVNNSEMKRFDVPLFQ